MGAERTADLWWKHCVIYCLDVETFADSDGDGHGDLDGLLARLDHLRSLGVSCLWLMPFYPTPNRDDGYDITDYFAVDRCFGNLGEFVEVIRTARDRGMRVIVDLVINHTSDEHPWFQEALSSRDNRYRDFYVWSDEPRDELFDMVIFPGDEDSNWEYHEPTGQYYLHRFYAHQPDLDITNPDVRDAFAEIVGFWLQVGVDGFRVDAVPYLIETTGTASAADEDVGGTGERPPEGPATTGPPDRRGEHDILRDLRRFMRRRNGGAAILGEVNLPMDEAAEYFGNDGDELNLVFAFDVNQQMWLSLAREDARPLADTLRALPPLADEVQWANFARLHDEANIGRLEPDEQAEVFAAFGPDHDMQVFERGIRRRLAPMLGGDPDRVRLVHSLVLTLPGTPVLYYGEEIGMGENLDLHGRLAVRTAMQWDDGPHGGFGPSDGEPPRRPPPGGAYGPEHVNVAAQRHDPASLLSWVTHAVHTRREIPEIGGGRHVVLETDDPAVLAHCCELEGSRFVAVHNLAGEERETHVELGSVEKPRPELRSDGTEMTTTETGVRIRLPRYGLCWLRTAPAPHGHTTGLRRS